MTEKIRQVLREHGRLPVDVEKLATNDSLYEAGMTSHASVNVMLAIEDAFDVEFPDEMLTRSAFSSIASIEAALNQLQSNS
jgi:acyl carrier protein